jgi:regulator of sigma E protease
MSWFLAFAGFAALIILHEFGHFVVAKLTGMRVERFFLFFPPKVMSFKRGETEYGVGAVPLGGFVKITGMNPDEELPPEVAHRGYYHQPVWKRIVVILAGPVMNLLIAFFILFGLAFGVEEAVGPGIEVGEVTEGSPAEGKLEDGDRIVSVDGVRAFNLDFEDRAERLREEIDSHSCAEGRSDGCAAETPAELVVSRDDRLVPLSITPEYDEARDRNLIGFALAPATVAPVNPSPREAAGISADFMWFVTSSTAEVFARIVDRYDELSGPVGSYEATRQAFEFDARTALTLLAVISLSLAIINLFPFLPLDGGHIFWSVVEKLRGRPVAFATMERAGVIGFMLVIFIFLIGLTNDIGRLTGEGINVR